MNEALILEKLDKLSDEVKSLKSDILQELKQDLEPAFKRPPSGVTGLLQEIEDEHAGGKLADLAKILLASLEELSEVVREMQTGDESKNVAKSGDSRSYPKTTQFFRELEGEVHMDELVILLRKTVTNMDTMGEGLDLLKAGVEFRDEMAPVLQLLYPKVLRFLNSLHEGEFQAEKLGNLLHTVLINIHTLSDLLNMIQPMTELVKEVGAVIKETDIINGLNIWLDSLQQGSGLVKLTGTMMSALKRLDCNEKQVDEISRTIKNLDLSKIEPVGPLGMIKRVNDPKVQEALGFFFMILQAVGTCLLACQDEN
ncbi:MAG: DUF1641 domain-containing protein [Deltaproteobacteria bacterium]|nr:DUF1641 domain-containing protein [Deltaproteobacteria bacterium]MBW2658687.1 DUF1641 domain-containing protein [Deltaproteobacteria bacterium]